MPADASFPEHTHSWGEFIYSFSGVLEVEIQGVTLIAPPHHALWLPPHIAHTGINWHEATYGSVYISPEFCVKLPEAYCAIAVTPLLRSVLEYLKQQQTETFRSEEFKRLLLVLVDQISVAEHTGNYLPTRSDDPSLELIFKIFEKGPNLDLSLADLSEKIGMSERTLARRFQSKVGMSFGEWRQRFRIVKAASLLRAGLKIEAIASELGYGSASSFIAMFRKMTGITPSGFRKGTDEIPKKLSDRRLNPKSLD